MTAMYAAYGQGRSQGLSAVVGALKRVNAAREWRHETTWSAGFVCGSTVQGIYILELQNIDIGLTGLHMLISSPLPVILLNVLQQRPNVYMYMYMCVRACVCALTRRLPVRVCASNYCVCSVYEASVCCRPGICLHLFVPVTDTHSLSCVHVLIAT